MMAAGSPQLSQLPREGCGGVPSWTRDGRATGRWGRRVSSRDGLSSTSEVPSEKRHRSPARLRCAGNGRKEEAQKSSLEAVASHAHRVVDIDLLWRLSSVARGRTDARVSPTPSFAKRGRSGLVATPAVRSTGPRPPRLGARRSCSPCWATRSSIGKVFFRDPLHDVPHSHLVEAQRVDQVRALFSGRGEDSLRRLGDVAIPARRAPIRRRANRAVRQGHRGRPMPGRRLEQPVVKVRDLRQRREEPVVAVEQVGASPADAEVIAKMRRRIGRPSRLDPSRSAGDSSRRSSTRSASKAGTA